MNHRLTRPLPEKLKPLAELAMDLRWTGSQTATRLWQRLDAETWERTRNPVTVLLNVHEDRLEEAAHDERLLADLEQWIERQRRHDASPTWFDSRGGIAPKPTIAYFSMEFGLCEALPVYSGGLGVLAGDHLKSASSLGVPLVGVGLLYQQGYFRQVIADDGSQIAVFPYNEPGSLPVSPTEEADGHWLRVRLTLPGRTLMLRVWEARVGAVRLLLLDSNDPMNSPEDRAITAQLYNADRKTRLLQELVLGVGGWGLLERLGIEADVCHLNEGHAAFAVVARAASLAKRDGVSFDAALWAARAGNVFTTHTPVDAAFDRFEPYLLRSYAATLAHEAGISIEDLLALGAEPSGDLFNMAFLALRGSARVNGVSRLHGEVSRKLFANLFPGLPYSEVPVAHVTNGVHVPTWDSSAANALWRKAYPRNWSSHLDDAADALQKLPDEDLWSFRNAARADLVSYVRHRLERRCKERAHGQAHAARCVFALDPHALTIGFARRFTSYKRPDLLLRDEERLARILSDRARPVQLLVAGKAHPNDQSGAAMVREVTAFCMRDDVWDRAIFLEDYDIAVAQALVGGVDVWLNNPARPKEACGTSGMKVLANGGLNVSTLDGWWDEAFEPDVGWAFGGRDEDDESSFTEDAAELYHLLESEIIPEFYSRDEHGLPRRWLRRVRASMTKLASAFTSDRMVREYTEHAYLPASAQFHGRAAGSCAAARELQSWHTALAHAWPAVHFGLCHVARGDACWQFEVELALGGLMPGAVHVQLYSEDQKTRQPTTLPMRVVREALHAADFALFAADAPDDRPAEDYTPRVIAAHPDAVLPMEAPFVRWQK